MLFNEYGVWLWTVNETTPPQEGASSNSEANSDNAQPQPQSPPAETDPADPVDSIPAANDVSVESSPSNPSPAAEDGFWALQSSATEEEIFELLKIPYVKPTDRIGPGNWGMVHKARKPKVTEVLQPEDTL